MGTGRTRRLRHSSTWSLPLALADALRNHLAQMAGAHLPSSFPSSILAFSVGPTLHWLSRSPLLPWESTFQQKHIQMRSENALETTGRKDGRAGQTSA